MKPIPDSVCHIILSGSTSGAMVYKLLDELKQEQYRQKNTLRLFIDSNGGLISSALTIARFLMSAFHRIETYAIGSVDSAAVCLFLSGSQRVATHSSRFFLHPPEIEIKGAMTAAKLRTVLQGLQVESACMSKYYSERTALPLKFWQRLLQRESYLDAEAALSKHLVTDIRETMPDFPPQGVVITA